MAMNRMTQGIPCIKLPFSTQESIIFEIEGESLMSDNRQSHTVVEPSATGNGDGSAGRSWRQLLQSVHAADRLHDVALLNLVCTSELRGASSLPIEHYLEWLNDAAEKVRLATERNYFKFLDAPEAFENSQARFCMVCLVTVLQRECGVHYNPKWKGLTRDCPVPEAFGIDANDLFIHAIIHGIGGTCGSLPVLYVAVGRRLGYPLRLVKAARHLFVRWDDPDGKHWHHSDRFNIEATGPGSIFCRMSITGPGLIRFRLKIWKPAFFCGRCPPTRGTGGVRRYARILSEGQWPAEGSHRGVRGGFAARAAQPAFCREPQSDSDASHDAPTWPRILERSGANVRPGACRAILGRGPRWPQITGADCLTRHATVRSATGGRRFARAPIASDSEWRARRCLASGSFRRVIHDGALGQITGRSVGVGSQTNDRFLVTPDAITEP